MIEAAQLKNRGVTVHAIMVAKGPSLSRSFSAIANTTGGRCFCVEDSLSLVQYIKCQAEVTPCVSSIYNFLRFPCIHGLCRST